MSVNDIKLSDRLLQSAGMVTPGGVVADIGCDHAHSCIYLLKSGAAKACIAMDVRKGPLEKAAANLKLYGCADRVELRLSYGLDKLGETEADTVIIAGMGGELIRDILKKDLNRFIEAKPVRLRELILQPQSHLKDVREYLADRGLIISEERICREDDKFYISMRAVPGGTPYTLSAAELIYGPCLLKNKDRVLHEFLEIEYRKKKYLLEQIEKSSKPEAAVKREEVFALFTAVKDALALY